MILDSLQLFRIFCVCGQEEGLYQNLDQSGKLIERLRQETDSLHKQIQIVQQDKIAELNKALEQFHLFKHQVNFYQI